MDFGSLWYGVNRWVSAWGMTFAFSMRAEGIPNLPARGPVLVIANHQSFLDPLAVGVAARRPVTALARKTLYRHRAFAWLIRSLHAYPIDQEGIGIQGLRVGVELLRQGRVLLVFPEGERTVDGTVGPLKPGISLLVKRAQAPIIPVGIAGAYAAWPRSRSYPLPAPLFLPASDRCIGVSVGQPLDSRDLAKLPREQILSVLSGELKKAVERAEKVRRKE